MVRPTGSDFYAVVAAVAFVEVEVKFQLWVVAWVDVVAAIVAVGCESHWAEASGRLV